jgi:hypothetical protein
MIELKRLHLLDSRIPSFPSQLMFCKNLKSSINKLVNNTRVPERFKPRLYTYADYILVAIYAICKGIPKHRAAQRLNHKMAMYQKKKLKQRLKQFNDGKRKRRLVPHQTDVDNFLGKLTEDEIQYIFGNLLSTLNQRIRKDIIGGSKMRFIVDNSEYPRYGKDFPPYDIGTVRKKGTKKCWLIQGHGLQGCGMHLFSEIRLLQKGRYRSAHIPDSVKWQRYLGFNLSYSLMDREFYRASLVHDLQKIKLPIIIPAKKFPGVKKVIQDYLLRSGPLQQYYWFRQKTGAKPYRKRTRLRLVIIGHKHVGAWQIRDDFKKKKISFDEAFHKLAAFFTTMPARKNVKRWSIWLSKAYKKRWNIETGFSKLNEIHMRFRCRSPTVFLAYCYIRAFIYNWWQAYRKVMSDHGYRKHDLTFLDFRDNLKNVLKREIKDSTRFNVRYGIKQKRRVYFLK